MGLTMYRIVILASGLFASGCGIFTYLPAKAMETNEVPSPNSAFVYGRFSKNHNEDARFGFVMYCDDSREYIIEFGPRTPQVIPINPARCALLGYVGVGRRGLVVRRDLFANSMKPVQFVAGKAYYLGDFAMQYSYRRADDSSTTITYLEGWGLLNENVDEYEGATDQMRLMYPRFKDIPTEKTLVTEMTMSSEDIAARETQNAREVAQKKALCSEENERCRVSCNDATDRVSCLHHCGTKNRECTGKLP